MLSFLPGPVKGSLSFLLMVINTLFWSVLLFSLAFFKLIIPRRGWRSFCNRILIWIATNWIAMNNANLRLFNNIEWDVKGVDRLEMNTWYLVLSNHQSWSDILVLQKIFNRKIPFLKFFLKQELIWVPVMGLAWWALDYPFMKRYSKEQIEKTPALKNKDLEITRAACRKFRDIPISVMNFVEGTRFTPVKHDRQDSPYARLLRPKAAGIAFVLGAMGGQLQSILNVTIAYPEGVVGLRGFLCGRTGKVRVRVEKIPVGPEVMGDYFEDDQFRARFQQWLNDLWLEKDGVMTELLKDGVGD